MSRVDVIVPCYNYGRFLRECVQSVLTQDGVEVRVLILDDASQDDSERVGRELAAEDGRVEYRRHTANRGHIETYNEGIAWAAGDYMLLLSADDLLLPGAFRRATALMDAHPNVGMIYGNAVFTDDPRRDAYHGPAAVGWKILTGHAYIAASCRRAGNLVPTPTAVVRTAVQHRIGGYRKDLTHSGDMEMWLRFAAHGDIGVLDAYQAYYRQHPTNMSNGYKGLGDLRQRALAFEALFHRDGNRLPEPGYHLQVAKERLSREALDQAYEAFEAGNNDLSKEYLRFAVAMSHRARFRRLYWRLRGKLVLGQRWLSYLRPWYRRVLARNRARSNNPLVNTPAPIS